MRVLLERPVPGFWKQPRSTLTGLNAIYGAFGGIMALLLWIYLSGCIFIFGACLCAAQAEALNTRN
jgi:uncharacterized BrkB/YihY/UPF0761 family membrane protein